MSAVPPYDPPPGQVTESTIHCTGCGYDLSGSALGGYCPECGRSVGESLPRATALTNTPGSVSCMVFGILSLAICAICGPLAIVQYFQVRRADDPRFHNPGSLTMAKAGLIMGMISTAILLLGAALVFLGNL